MCIPGLFADFSLPLLVCLPRVPMRLTLCVTSFMKRIDSLSSLCSQKRSLTIADFEIILFLVPQLDCEILEGGVVTNHFSIPNAWHMVFMCQISE